MGASTYDIRFVKAIFDLPIHIRDIPDLKALLVLLQWCSIENHQSLIYSRDKKGTYPYYISPIEIGLL